jgi:hypothetical protein
MNTVKSLVVLNDDDVVADQAAKAPLPVLNEQEEVAAPSASKAALPAGAKVLDDGSIEFTPSRKLAIEYKKPDGSAREEAYPVLVFHRLKGSDLRAVTEYEGKNPGDFMIARAMHIGIGKAGLIFDAADAVDSQAILQIVGFLSGNGQKTGR